MTWKVVEYPEAFAVVDADDRPVKFFYFADEKHRWFYQPVRMLKDEARQAAEKMAKTGDAFSAPDDPT
jgi:hypothetical protein